MQTVAVGAGASSVAHGSLMWGTGSYRTALLKGYALAFIREEWP